MTINVSDNIVSHVPHEILEDCQVGFLKRSWDIEKEQISNLDVVDQQGTF